MNIFKPKRPRKTLMAILADGKLCRAARDRLILWEIRYENATGQAPSSSAMGRYESHQRP